MTGTLFWVLALRGTAHGLCMVLLFGTLRLFFFFRRRRFGISINLGCISSALHTFSGIITLYDQLVCVAVTLSTSGTKFTVAWSYDVENRHHAYN